MKFGLKIPNRLEQMSEPQEGDIFTNTLCFKLTLKCIVGLWYISVNIN